MPTDGSGNYSLPDGSIVTTGTTATAASQNTPNEDIAAALTARLMANGAKTWTGNQNAGGYRITGMGEAVSDADAVTLSQVQDLIGSESFSGDYNDLTNKPTLGTAAAKNVGTSAGNVVELDGSGKLPAVDGSQLTNISAAAALPRGYINGLILSNAADATNDITVTAGVARNSANTADMSLAAAITKQLDAVWASGTNAGGRFAASISDALWYVFLISNGATVDVGFSTNADPTSDPNYPSGYTSYRRIGFIIRSSGAILGFTQNANAPDYIRLNAPVADVAVSNNTTTTAVTVTSLCPPNCEADLSVVLDPTGTASGTYYLRIRPSSEPNVAASATSFDFMAKIDTAYYPASGPKRVQVDASRQYAYRKEGGANSGVNLRIYINGWYDRRAT